jgi:hypothetical protein
MTDGARTFLQELEEAVSRGSPESCLRALWHATDLLIAGRYSEAEIWTFGEVIGRLAEQIELESRCRLAKRLTIRLMWRVRSFDDPNDWTLKPWLLQRGLKVSSTSWQFQHEDLLPRTSQTSWFHVEIKRF